MRLAGGSLACVLLKFSLACCLTGCLSGVSGSLTCAHLGLGGGLLLGSGLFSCGLGLLGSGLLFRSGLCLFNGLACLLGGGLCLLGGLLLGSGLTGGLLGGYTLSGSGSLGGLSFTCGCLSLGHSLLGGRFLGGRLLLGGGSLLGGRSLLGSRLRLRLLRLRLGHLLGLGLKRNSSHAFSYENLLSGLFALTAGDLESHDLALTVKVYLLERTLFLCVVSSSVLFSGGGGAASHADSLTLLGKRFLCAYLRGFKYNVCGWLLARLSRHFSFSIGYIYYF